MKKRTANSIIDFIFSVIFLFFPEQKSGYFRRYNKDWDLILNKIIDDGNFRRKDFYEAHFFYDEVQYSIWIGNYPYDYGYAYKINEEYVPYDLKFRASEKTMVKLHDFLDATYIDEDKKKVEKLKKHIIGKE